MDPGYELVIDFEISEKYKIIETQGTSHSMPLLLNTELDYGIMICMFFS